MGKVQTELSQDEVIDQKLRDAETPGYEVSFDPEERTIFCDFLSDFWNYFGRLFGRYFARSARVSKCRDWHRFRRSCHARRSDVLGTLSFARGIALGD